MQFNLVVLLLTIASQFVSAEVEVIAPEKRDIAQGVAQVGKVVGSDASKAGAIVAADASKAGGQVAQVGGKIAEAGSKYGSKLGKGALIGAAGLGVADVIYEFGKHVEHNKAISESMAMSKVAASAASMYAATATHTSHASTLVTAYISS